MGRVGSARLRLKFEGRLLPTLFFVYWCRL